MFRGSSDTEECKLYDAEYFGLYMHVTSGCEYINLNIKDGVSYALSTDKNALFLLKNTFVDYLFH